MKEKKPKRKKTFADFLLTLVLLGAIGVFVYAGYNLVHIYLEYKKGVDEYNSIAEMAVTERAPDAPDETGSSGGGSGTSAEGDANKSSVTPPMQVDFAKLMEVNPDVCGWIYVEALDGVNYPVVRGSDNDYYLHRTYEGTYNFAGTIFMDYENSRDFSDCNTMLYGHNMKNGSMFGQLKHFSNDGETFKKSKYFWIFTPEASLRYEIISAHRAAVDGYVYTLFKGPGTEFAQYLEQSLADSTIPDQPAPSRQPGMQDKIVTLSTCTGDGDYSYRYVVQGLLVDRIPNE